MENNELTGFDTTLTAGIAGLIDEETSYHKIAIKTDALKNAISKIERSIGKLTTRDIDKYIYLEVTDDQLTFAANNPQWLIQSVVKNTKEDSKFQLLSDYSFSYCILGSLFADIVRKIQHSEMTLTFEEGRVVIETNSMEFFVPTKDSDEFVKSPSDLTVSSSVTLKSDALHYIYSNVSYAASTSLQRPVLTGINHSIQSNELTCTAADGIRVARVVYPLDKEMESISTTVPATVANEICKLIKDDEDVRISLSDKTIVYHFNDTIIFASLLVEAYPEVDKLIPTELPIHIDVTHAFLKEALSFTSLYETDKVVIFMIDPAHGQLRIKTPETEKGKFKKDISISGEGDALSVAFNTRYLEQSLKKFGEQDVLRFTFGNNLSPFLMKLKNGSEQDLDLFMPIRTAESKMEADIVDFKVTTEFKAFKEVFETIQ